MWKKLPNFEKWILAMDKMEGPYIPDTINSLVGDIKACNMVFRRACRQCEQLNIRIQETKTRYDRACANGQLSFRYQHRLTLTSLEGARNMCYEYATRLCEKIEGLQVGKAAD